MHTGAPRRRRMGLGEQRRFVYPSALPACLGREEGDALFYPGAFAFRAGSPDLAVLGNALNNFKFLLALLAFIFVCGHVPPPFLTIRFQTK